MNYVSKIYNQNDVLYAEDMNNIITGIDELVEMFEEAHAENVNLLDVEKLDHKLRYSPGTGSIVDSSGTKYSLFVCKLKSNTTYNLSYCVGGFGLFASQPIKGVTAAYKFETSYSTTTFNTKECQWIAANAQMVETNTADTVENTPVDAWLNAYLTEVPEVEEDNGDCVTKEELFT